MSLKKIQENFAMKIKPGEKGSFNGIAMTIGIPEGKPYFNFTKESLADNIGKTAKLMLDHDKYSSRKAVGTVKFTSFDGKNLMFEAQLLMEAKDVADEVYPRLKAGILDAVSVGITFEEYEEADKDIMKIKKFSIDELSIVTFPAFKKAKIKNVFSQEDKDVISRSMKTLFSESGVEIKESISFEDIKLLTQKEFEAIIKVIGFSNSLSVKMGSLVKPLLKENGQSEFGNQNANKKLTDLEKIEKFLKGEINKKTN